MADRIVVGSAGKAKGRERSSSWRRFATSGRATSQSWKAGGETPARVIVAPGQIVEHALLGVWATATFARTIRPVREPQRALRVRAARIARPRIRRSD